MRETTRLALLRGETLVWPLQNFLVLAHVEARILGPDLGARGWEATLVMLSGRCGEPQRRIAEEDCVHCRERARVVRAQRLRGFQLPGCSSLAEGCALLLLLAKIVNRTVLTVEENGSREKRDEMQGLAKIE
jgi:hypothetical protein